LVGSSGQEARVEIIDIAVAELRLDALVERAMAGERICLARNGEPVIELVPVRAETGQRRFGALRGELKVPQEFFDLLPDDELPAGMETRWADGMEFTKEQEALLNDIKQAAWQRVRPQFERGD
jgi:antitoxin (DNA-binding transcriptional repressor) of toxin-antitoxin stability system